MNSRYVGSREANPGRPAAYDRGRGSDHPGRAGRDRGGRRRRRGGAGLGDQRPPAARGPGHGEPPSRPAPPPCCRCCAAPRCWSTRTTWCSRRPRRRTRSGWCAAPAWSSEELADLVRQVRRDGQIRESEFVMTRPDLPSRTVTARVAPLGSRMVLALVEDRTRERRVEAIRRDFVANVSHELKTPVGAIRLLVRGRRRRRRRPGGGEALLRADDHRERPALPAGAADHRAVPAPGRRPARVAAGGVGRRDRRHGRRHQRDRRRDQAHLAWSPAARPASRCSATGSS